MNESNDIYVQFGINKSRLKRDYIENPLKRSKSKYLNENVDRDDFYYLFNELNLTANDLSKIFGWGKDCIYNWSKKYNIKKSKSQIINHMEQTNLEKYGVKCIFQSNNVKQKIYSKCQENYGVKYYSQVDSVKQKIIKTNLEKYGVEYFTQSDEYKHRQKEYLQSLSIEVKEKYRLQQRMKNINPKANIELIQKLSDKDLLINEIKQYKLNSTSKLVQHFGINRSNINRIIREYDIRYLMDDNLTSFEREISEYVQQYYNISTNNRSIFKQEIDIYIPEKKFGIEFNGNWWHSEYHKSKNYHQEKSKLAEKQGVFIYHIFEYEWYTKREQLLNQLNNLLGINENKIGARSCIIKEVSNKEKSLFLETNHLQGNDSSSIKLGLYYNDELVSIMTFCKPRFNKNYEWELSRFCCKANCNVIGGASKLFKYFIDTYKPKSIISYSNIAHTRGNLYKTLGFKLDSISEPNYVWYRSNKVLTRYQCQKHKLLEQGFIGNSEVDIMHNRGYYRIYDCGNKVWAWNL